MNNVKFTALLKRAGNASEKHRILLDEVCQESIRRYGITYNAADCDYIIDALDYGVAPPPTAAVFDGQMRLALKLNGDVCE